MPCHLLSPQDSAGTLQPANVSHHTGGSPIENKDIFKPGSQLSHRALATLGRGCILLLSVTTSPANTQQDTAVVWWCLLLLRNYCKWNGRQNASGSWDHERRGDVRLPALAESQPWLSTSAPRRKGVKAIVCISTSSCLGGTVLIFTHE